MKKSMTLPENLAQMEPEELIALIERRKAVHRELVDAVAEANRAFFADVEACKAKLFRRYQSLRDERNQNEAKKKDLDQRLVTATVNGTKAEIESLQRERNQLQADILSADEQMEVIAAYRVAGSDELLAAAERAYADMNTDAAALREFVNSIQAAANARITAFREVVQYPIGQDTVPDISKATALHTQPEEFRKTLQQRIEIDELKSRAREAAWVEQKTRAATGSVQVAPPPHEDKEAQPRQITVYRTIEDPVSGRPRRVQVDPKTGEPIFPLLSVT